MFPVEIHFLSKGNEKWAILLEVGFSLQVFVFLSAKLSAH